MCPCVHLQVPDLAIPHQIITYLRVSLGRPTVKIPTKPLATTAEESTELVEASSDELISHQVLMEEEGEDDGISPNAGDENDTKREA
jgi:hypothetical protein